MGVCIGGFKTSVDFLPSVRLEVGVAIDIER